MAHTKSCSGTQTTNNLPLQPPSCNYDLQLFIDGTPINSIVSINSTMSDSTIAGLLNSNRINNTTGTFAVSTVVLTTSITINNIVLSSSALGVYTINTNTALPCAELIDGAPVTLTCNIIPDNNTKRRGVPLASQRCPDEVISSNSYPLISYCNNTYTYYETDTNGFVHYINSRSNISKRGTQNWWVIYI